MKKMKWYLAVIMTVFIFSITVVTNQFSDKSESSERGNLLDTRTDIDISKQSDAQHTISKNHSLESLIHIKNFYDLKPSEFGLMQQLVDCHTLDVNSETDMAQIIKFIGLSPYYKYHSFEFTEPSTVVIKLDILYTISEKSPEEAFSNTELTSKRDDIEQFRSDAMLMFSLMKNVEKITFNVGAFINLTFTRAWAEAELIEGAPSHSENGPFVGFISDEKSANFEVYSEKNATYMTCLPMTLLDRLYEGKKCGWIEGVDVYYGESEDFIWGAIATGANLGKGRVNVSTSLDQGKNWWIGDPNSMYSGTVTGAGFASKNVGFLSYRYFMDEGPEIARTLDGGKTWDRMKITPPDSLKGQCFTPFNPTFDENTGIYPVMSSLDSKMIFLMTEDGGLTWQWQEYASDAISAAKQFGVQ